ncbi:MAG: alcohol dehydrogenase catalytic domain-containing protein [Planctomycetota bacterium]
MKALLIDQNGPRLESAYTDPIGTNSTTLVRVLCTGVGGLDLAAVAGRIEHAGVLGHEIVGRVESCDADPSLIGATVAVDPELPCCSCDRCASGMPRHCRSMRRLGFGSTDGGLAEFVAVPRRNLVKVPTEVEVESAVFAQAVADAVHVSRLVPVQRTTYVTVIGDGVSALLIAQILARRNASVRLLGARPDRFGLCERWRIRHRDIREAGLRADQDVVVACFDAQLTEADLSGREAAERAIGMLRPRGALVVSGPAVPIEGVGLDLSNAAEAVVSGELRLIGSRRGAISEGVAAIAAGEVDLAPLITSRVRLDDGVGLLRTAADPRQLRTLVRVAA